MVNNDVANGLTRIPGQFVSGADTQTLNILAERRGLVIGDAHFQKANDDIVNAVPQLQTIIGDLNTVAGRRLAGDGDEAIRLAA